MSTTTTYHTDPANRTRIIDKITKAQLRAAKLGLTGGYVIDSFQTETDTRGNVWETVTVTGTPWTVPDGEWQFVAWVDMISEVTHTLPTWSGPVPARQWMINTHCEHCRTTRQRDKMVIIHSETYGWLRLGSTCVRRFLGITWTPFLADANPFAEDHEGSHPVGTTTLLLLTVAAMMVREHGWMSRKQADTNMLADRGSSVSTADRVRNYLRPLPKAPTPTETLLADDEQTARAAIEWVTHAATQPGASEWVSNGAAIVGNQWVRSIDEALAISVVGVHVVNLQRQAEAEPMIEKPYAPPKSRITLDAEYVGCRVWETAYGTSHTHTFHAEGHRFEWKTSPGSWADRLNKGDQVRIAGTVKGQREWQDHLWTTILRVKLAETK